MEETGGVFVSQHSTHQADRRLASEFVQRRRQRRRAIGIVCHIEQGDGILFEYLAAARPVDGLKTGAQIFFSPRQRREVADHFQRGDGECDVLQLMRAE